ncbi:MAG: hypothetical protein LBB29_03620 [Holosporaceae bacterium]|nr:hypothetical protein [Holosporaceae bacterium]
MIKIKTLLGISFMSLFGSCCGMMSNPLSSSLTSFAYLSPMLSSPLTPSSNQSNLLTTTLLSNSTLVTSNCVVRSTAEAIDVNVINVEGELSEVSFCNTDNLLENAKIESLLNDFGDSVEITVSHHSARRMEKYLKPEFVACFVETNGQNGHKRIVELSITDNVDADIEQPEMIALSSYHEVVIYSGQLQKLLGALKNDYNLVLTFSGDIVSPTMVSIKKEQPAAMTLPLPVLQDDAINPMSTSLDIHTPDVQGNPDDGDDLDPSDLNFDEE